VSAVDGELEGFTLLLDGAGSHQRAAYNVFIRSKVLDRYNSQRLWQVRDVVDSISNTGNSKGSLLRSLESGLSKFAALRMDTCPHTWNG
jgi:hypothetical protein